MKNLVQEPLRWCSLDIPYSKGYVTYWEHPNDGMTEIDFCNVNLLEDECPTIGEIKKDVELYELQPVSYTHLTLPTKRIV